MTKKEFLFYNKDTVILVGKDKARIYTRIPDPIPEENINGTGLRLRNVDSCSV